MPRAKSQAETPPLSSEPPRVEVVWEPTPVLLQFLNPENPRDHFEEDIQATALSLLEAGWAEIGISRQRDGNLIGGHGRAQAADWLSNQAQDWFDHQWDVWVSRYPERKEVAAANRQRFSPAFWRKCPVNYVDLDPLTQKSTMIRLNNPHKDGRDNNSKLAALLSQMDKPAQEQAGWNPKTAESFMAAFIEKKKTAPPPEEDFQDKQHFERHDATDYSGHGDTSPDDAIAESGEWSAPSLDDDDHWDSSTQVVTADGSIATVAGVESIEETFGADVFDFTKQYSETRAVLYLSQDDYAEYKQMVAIAADVMKVDTDSQIAKIWRSQTIMAVLRHVTAGKQLSKPVAEEDDQEET